MKYGLPISEKSLFPQFPGCCLHRVDHKSAEDPRVVVTLFSLHTFSGPGDHVHPDLTPLVTKLIL